MHNMKKINMFLIVGGVLSIIASLLHIAIVLGGGDWYRFFGAGEALAAMDEAGEWYPKLLTLGIAAILFFWAIYAFSGAGLFIRLPLLRSVLFIISAIYLVRGFGFVPLWLFWPEYVNGFVVWSSFVCMVYGVCYAIGTWQIWNNMLSEEEVNV